MDDDSWGVHLWWASRAEGGIENLLLINNELERPKNKDLLQIIEFEGVRKRKI